jgi:four helix bundle protein
VYKKAFSLSMEIYHRTKLFPKEEQYSLTDQVRRSSRSVCINLGEGYRKRQYEAHFVAKISDADSENTETQIWLDYAQACGYLSEQEHALLLQQNEEIGRLLAHMVHHPDRYLGNLLRRK